MAFTKATLLPLSGMANSDAPRHWTYGSADASATIVAADYFITAGDLLTVNDIIWAVGATGGTQTMTMLLVKTATTAGVTVLGTVQILA
jgi:hypothetical protein